MMVRFLSLRRSDQPYLGELDFDSWPVTPCSAASHSSSSSHASADGPSAAETSLGVGCAALPTNAFGVSMVFLSGGSGRRGNRDSGEPSLLVDVCAELADAPVWTSNERKREGVPVAVGVGASPAFGLG